MTKLRFLSAAVLASVGLIALTPATALAWGHGYGPPGPARFIGGVLGAAATLAVAPLVIAGDIVQSVAAPQPGYYGGASAYYGPGPGTYGRAGYGPPRGYGPGYAPAGAYGYPRPAYGPAAPGYGYGRGPGYYQHSPNFYRAQGHDYAR